MLIAALAVGCGGGGGGGVVTPPPTAFEVPSEAMAISAAATTASPPGPQVVSIAKEAETVVSGNLVDLRFRVQLNAQGVSSWNAKAQLTGVGADSIIIDADAVVGDLSGSAVVTAADTITIRHDKTKEFQPSALRFTLTGTQPPATTLGTLASLGIRSAALGDDAPGAIEVVSGGTQFAGLHISQIAGSDPKALHISASTLVAGVQVLPDGSGIFVDAAKWPAGTSTQTFDIQVTDAQRGVHALIPVRVNVVPVVEQKTFQLAAIGAQLSTIAGQIEFSSNGLQRPVGVTVLVGQTTGSGRDITVRFDRDVSGQQILITLPQPGAQATGPSASPSAPPRSDMRRHALAAGTDDACARMTSGEYYATTLAGAEYKMLGYEVLQRQAWFYWNRRMQGSAIVVDGKSSTADGGSINVSKKAASLVEAAVGPGTSCVTGRPLDPLGAVDWTLYEPVLLVHGYTAGGGRGGGEGTWGRMAALMIQTEVSLTGKRFVPFEFRWKTDADFRTVAADLGNAINFLRQKTGKSVHVVAHSFGGVAIRTLLQDLARAIPSGVTSYGSMAAAKAAVASVTTLGTPHGGVLPADTNLNVSGSVVTLPRGRDNLTVIGACRQITCHQMGEETSAVYNLIGYTHDDLTPGILAAQLHQTRDRLPNIPINVGIGLTVDGGAYEDGDRLISFAGQRFLSAGGTAAVSAAALANELRIGQATVSEVVLGAPKGTLPGAKAGTSLATQRSGGYRHAGGDDGGFILDEGLEAGVASDCKSPAICTHAGYLLFSQTVNNALGLNLRSAIEQARAAPTTLALNADKLVADQAAGRLLGDIARLQNMLTELRPYAFGNRVQWSRLPHADVIRHNGTMNEVLGDTPEIQAAIERGNLELTRLDKFQGELINSQNVYVVLDAENLKTLSEIAVNTTKGAFAAARMAEITNPLGSVKFFGGITASDPLKLMEWTAILKKLAKAAEFAEAAGTCGAATLDALAIGLETRASQGEIDNSKVGPLMVDVVKCLVGVLSSDATPVKEYLSTIGKLAVAGLDMNGDGKTDGPEDVNMMVGLTAVLSGLLDFMKPVPIFANIQGFIDVLNAGFANYAAGLKLASHTGEVVSLREDEAQRLIAQLRESVLHKRSALIAAARAKDLFIAVPQILGSTASTPSPLVSGFITEWTVTSVFEAVKSILWQFGSAAGTWVAQVVDGAAAAVRHVFDKAGLVDVVAVFKDALGGVLSSQTNAASVAQGPVVTAVTGELSVVTAGVKTTFTVAGTQLPVGLAFQLAGCETVAAVAGGTTAQRQFTCTFPATAAAGVAHGSIGPVGSAGTPFDSMLKGFEVTVVAATVVPRITAAIEITPAAPVVGDTITFIARGEGLLNTGWLFKFSGMDFCGMPGATPTQITATELRYSCAATAPTNLLGTVAVTSGDLVSQHGSAVLVRVGCPTGSVLNTQTAQCQADAGGNLKLGLVGHWSFDACDAKDSSPNALHGEVSGAPVCVTGKSGKALRFNGATDWITVPSAASFPSQAVTLSYWLHREGNAVTGNLQNYLSKEIAFQSYLMPNAALTAGLWLGTTGFWSEHGSTPSTLPTLTDWVHFAFTYDNATRTAKNYVNGVLVETTVNAYANAVVRQSPYPLYIGRNGSANVYWIKGLLDEVRVYDRVLSAADVLALQQGTGSNAAGSSLLPPTGAHSAQCFIAGSGSGNVQSCVGADALALSGAGKQDGMILRNFNYAELPRAGGGNFARTECVFDGFTGLVWEGKTADGGARDGSKATYTDAGDGRASDAAAYAAQVNLIALCGFTDWRVPNIAELQSIVHYGMGSGRPAIDLAWFPNSQGGYGTYYRTITPYRIPYVDRDKFVLSLWDGAANWAFNERGHHLRLVRGGNSAVAGSRFVEQAGGSEVLDSATGLVWSRCSMGQTWAGNACVGAALLVTHEAALAHVKAIAGWRLPNIKELVSIVNFTRASPAVDIAVFPQTPQQPHWTSTAFVDGGSAWGVDFNSALFGPNGRFYAQPFRLVRAQ